MKKSLQILFGLLLVLVLAYVAFLDVSTKIKDDLLTKTKIIFNKNNIKDVTVKLEGEGLSLSRSLVLTGTAISEIERVRIVALIKDIEGVKSVENLIELYPVVPTAPTVPVVPSVPKVPTVIKVPLVKTSPTPKTAKSTLTETEVSKRAEKKAVIETLVEKKEDVTSSVSASPLVSNLPLVPKVESSNIIVPTPVQVISVPKVIEVEKIKLEGVK